LNITTAKAEVCKPAMGYRLVRPGLAVGSCRGQPFLQVGSCRFGKIEKMHSSLAVRIGPGNLSVCFNLQPAIRKLELETQKRAMNLSFWSQHIHSALAKIEQNSIDLSIVGKANFDGRLYRYAESTAALPI